MRILPYTYVVHGKVSNQIKIYAVHPSLCQIFVVELPREGVCVLLDEPGRAGDVEPAALFDQRHRLEIGKLLLGDVLADGPGEKRRWQALTIIP